MIVFHCHLCHLALSVEDALAGQRVRCSGCRTALSVPAAPAKKAAALRAQPLAQPAVPAGAQRHYGFACVYCSSRLEATSQMAGQSGTCPTCGNDIVVPILDRYGRLLDPLTRKLIKPDPHPVHAYAAAGTRAPLILRDEQGIQHIACPRCGHFNPVSANQCASCTLPFTMEGTVISSANGTNGYAVASLVLGIIGLPASCALVPSLLAVLCGTIGYRQCSAGEGGRGLAIAGMTLGAIGLLLGLLLMIAA